MLAAVLEHDGFRATLAANGGGLGLEMDGDALRLDRAA